MEAVIVDFLNEMEIKIVREGVGVGRVVDLRKVWKFLFIFRR